MGARFRYLGPGGREIEIATTDELVRAFTSGTLSQDTLLYDAHGGGWAPARSHSALLGIALPPAPVQRVGRFTLAEPTPEDPREVMAKLLRDKEQTPEIGALPPVPVTRGKPRESFRVPESPALVESPRSWAPPPRSAPRAQSAPSAPSAPRPRAQPVWVVGLPAEPRTSSAASRGLVTWTDRARRLASLIGPAGAGAVGVLFVVLIVVFAQSPASGGKGAVRPVAAAGPGSEVLSPVEGEALEAMVVEMESRRAAFGIDRVPAAWLEGIYLAEASRFPDVKEYWLRYTDYVREMRASEKELFKASLTKRLTERGLSDSQMAMQLAGALNGFEADEPRRLEAYDAMLELAVAALALHELLLEHEDEISYEPAAAGLSREPITEAVPENRQLGDELNGRLDRLFAALEATQGSRVAPREELPLALRRALTSNARAPMR